MVTGQLSPKPGQTGGRGPQPGGYPVDLVGVQHAVDDLEMAVYVGPVAEHRGGDSVQTRRTHVDRRRVAECQLDRLGNQKWRDSGEARPLSTRCLLKGPMLLVVAAMPSIVGCPVVPPASQWGATDTGCLDHWSLAHFGSGVLLGEALGDDGFWPSMAVLACWEVVEPSFWPGETARNQQCDMGVGGLGWLASLTGGR